jgi:hypothetical protein
MNLEVSRQILEKKKVIKFNEIPPVGAELFHAEWRTDGQTDRHTDITMQIVVFRNFANTPESWFPSLRGVLTVSGVIHNTRDIS